MELKLGQTLHHNATGDALLLAMAFTRTGRTVIVLCGGSESVCTFIDDNGEMDAGIYGTLGWTMEWFARRVTE